MGDSKKSRLITLDDLQFVHYKYTVMDFNINGVFAGYQKCPMTKPEQESHTFGPIIRDYYTLNYITRGHGVMTLNGIEHPMHAGQVYATFPGTVVTLYTERPDYWEYYYLFFKSSCISKYLRSMNFSEITPAFPHENITELLPFYDELIDLCKSGKNNPFDQTISVCRMFSILAGYVSKCDTNNVFESTNNFIEKALQYFEINYPNRISISDVAGALGLDRSYFSRIFKQHMDISPQEYLIHLRMKKACEFLAELSVPISNVAYSVGYEPFTFSRTFKQVTGLSPTEYREQFKK